MELQADVVVVGFGAAGACAALAAAETGSEVLVLDRFAGGGATALSGGVVYAGGGTPQQKEAGVEDTVDAMHAYLRTEVGDAVGDATLRAFCEGSVEMLGWLQAHGVPFDSTLCPHKTSYPTNDYYLYYSGSEISARDVAAPAPRGHRTHGRGTSGRVLFDALAKAVGGQGIRVMPQTRAESLIVEDGRVTGVQCRTLSSRGHRLLTKWAAKPYLYFPKLGRLLHRRAEEIERRQGKTVTIRARKAVILAAGGFVTNRAMMREHAPLYRGGLPLGTRGDDGGGINLGIAAGAATDHLDRVSVWRFITPPEALLKGVLVDKAGQRVGDESRYGAALGEAIVRRHHGWAGLVVDSAVLAEARRQLKTQSLWFQRLSLGYVLRRDLITAPTLHGLAQKAGVDPEGLLATVEAYHRDPGKAPQFVQELSQPPFSLIDCSVRPRLANPAPMLTLGGLVVSEESGQVLRADGEAIGGLYAAGRTAVGICSNSYVSGLSLADCVFSGRRAGRHAGAA